MLFEIVLVMNWKNLISLASHWIRAPEFNRSLRSPFRGEVVLIVPAQIGRLFLCRSNVHYNIFISHINARFLINSLWLWRLHSVLVEFATESRREFGRGSERRPRSSRPPWRSSAFHRSSFQSIGLHFLSIAIGTSSSWIPRVRTAVRSTFPGSPFCRKCAFQRKRRR
jgi:hypothetical protein